MPKQVKYGVIASHTIGHIAVLNSMMPIENIVYYWGPRHYCVSWSVCNGIGHGSTKYRTKEEVLKAAGIREEVTCQE